MPCLQTKELKSKVKGKKDEVVLAKEELLGQEMIPSKESAKTQSNSDGLLEAQQNKRELKENRHTGEDKTIYNMVVQGRNSDEFKENIPSDIDEDVNNLNKVERKKPDGLDENTLIDNNNTNDSDKKILLILVKSEITQVGNNNHMTFEDEKIFFENSTEDSDNDLHVTLR